MSDDDELKLKLDEDFYDHYKQQKIIIERFKGKMENQVFLLWLEGTEKIIKILEKKIPNYKIRYEQEKQAQEKQAIEHLLDIIKRTIK
jgi:hypothetical protein